MRYWWMYPVLLLSCACSGEGGGESPAERQPLKPAAAHGGTAAPVSAGALKYKAPPEWIAEQPKSSMRQAQYRLPRAQGDPEDAELVVFYFQGSGGAVQANIDRWIAQFKKADGSPADDQAKTSRRRAGDIPLTVVDVSGTYMSSSGPMLSEVQEKPGFRMLGAVAETAAGPWFFKLTGPARTVARWENQFHSFLDTIGQ